MIHQCSICGVNQEWNDNWSWYGSIKDMENGLPIVKTCSEECREIAGQAPIESKPKKRKESKK